MPANSKVARLQARTTLAQKSCIEDAASLLGFSKLSEYMVSVLVQDAQRVIRENSVMVLSERDRKSFINALSKPSKPNKALLKAARAYKKDMGLE